MPPAVREFPDAAALAHAAARRFVAEAAQAAAARGRFAVALSGGSSPSRLYELLASQAYRGQVDWARVHVFWGDERCVPPDHADSSFRLAHAALLEHVPLPEENVHRIAGEAEPKRAADDYDRELRSFFRGQAGFDLILLGLGADGHTASLFPESPALLEAERWAVAVEHTRPPPPLVTRITLTLPVINAAQLIVFLVVGESKAERLRAVLAGADLPAARVRPATGRLIWLTDFAARAGPAG